MNPMNIAEKILSRQSDQPVVKPGDIVVVNVSTCVVIDVQFYEQLGWRWPKTLHDPDSVVIIADHIVMGAHSQAAQALRDGRLAAEHYGITRLHDVGAEQGISHQVVADRAYALPGTVLACADSHTLSGGALNCCARGLGTTEILYALCTGKTWFRVGPTVRYELHGSLPRGVTAKDAFLYMAGRWGSHEGQNIEFGGPGQAGLSLDARRTWSTMCAEVSAEFALWEPDDKLLDHVKAQTDRAFYPTWPDEGAAYFDARRIDLDQMVPHISGIDGVVHNTKPLSEFDERIRLDQCVVGSCANGTLDDLRAVAEILRGRSIAPWVRFFVTPGSQKIYRQASAEGTLATITASGALVTPSACGACAAQDFGALAPGEVCLTATTRNYKGRMGTSDAKIYMASPMTVAASAVAGYISNPADLAKPEKMELAHEI